LLLALAEPLLDVVDQIRRRRARAEELADALRVQLVHILLRDDAATGEEKVVAAGFGEEILDACEQRHVGAAQHRQADNIHVLLNGGVGDHLRRLVQPGVDDFHAGVAARGGDDVWVEIRRRRIPEDDRVPDEFFAPSPAHAAAPAAAVTYAEAVELALCFGWIDGQRLALDATFFRQRFTPRGPRSRWSQINRDKATALIAAGAMQPPGLAEVERAWHRGRPYDLVVIDEMMPGLAGDALAKRIRAIPAVAETKLLMSSSGGSHVLSPEAQADVDAVLAKPIHEQSLLDALARLFGIAGGDSGRPQNAKIESPESSNRPLRVLVAEDKKSIS